MRMTQQFQTVFEIMYFNMKISEARSLAYVHPSSSRSFSTALDPVVHLLHFLLKPLEDRQISYCLIYRAKVGQRTGASLAIFAINTRRN